MPLFGFLVHALVTAARTWNEDVVLRVGTRVKALWMVVAKRTGLVGFLLDGFLLLLTLLLSVLAKALLAWHMLGLRVGHCSVVYGDAEAIGLLLANVHTRS